MELGGGVVGLLPTVGGNVSFLNEVLVSMSVSLMKVVSMSVFVDNCGFQCQFFGNWEVMSVLCCP